MLGLEVGKADRKGFDVAPDRLVPTVATVEINLVHIHNMRCASVYFRFCLLFLTPGLFILNIYTNGRIDVIVAL